eukprot:3937605-Rhodomonas_salina.2
MLAKDPQTGHAAKASGGAVKRKLQAVTEDPPGESLDLSSDAARATRRRRTPVVDIEDDEAEDDDQD